MEALESPYRRDLWGTICLGERLKISLKSCLPIFYIRIKKQQLSIIKKGMLQKKPITKALLGPTILR